MSSHHLYDLSEPTTPLSTIRLDADAQQRVLTLAAEMQRQHQERLHQTVTVAELEAAAAEAGLDPLYVRKAVLQLSLPEQVEVQPQETPQTQNWLRSHQGQRYVAGSMIVFASMLGMMSGENPLVFTGALLGGIHGLIYGKPKKAFMVGFFAVGAELFIASMCQDGMGIRVPEFLAFAFLSGVGGLMGAGMHRLAVSARKALFGEKRAPAPTGDYRR